MFFKFLAAREKLEAIFEFFTTNKHLEEDDIFKTSLKKRTTIFVFKIEFVLFNDKFCSSIKIFNFSESAAKIPNRFSFLFIFLETK